MGRNRYYLCARNIGTNEFKTISLSEKEIYDKGTSTENSCNDLEDIDYFTMQYEDVEHLIKHLVDQGKLDSSDNELFITVRKGDKYSFYENIYSVDKLSEELSGLIEKIKGISDDVNSDDEILNTFTQMMLTDTNYNMFINSYNHNIYNKLIEYYQNYSDADGIEQIKHKDSGWIRLSYPLLRNIVESIKRYEIVKESDNIVSASGYYADKLENKRHNKRNEIMIQTEKEYDNNQLSLLSSEKKSRRNKR